MTAVLPTTDVQVRRARRWPPVSVVLAGLVLVGVVLLVIVPGLAPHDPDRVDPADALQGASASHWFGTDQLGRDIASRVVAGARTAFLAPLALAISTVVLGVAIGLLAGLRGGWVDGVVSRVIEVLYAVPTLIIAIIVVGVTRGGLGTALAVLVVFGLPSTVRVMRAAVLERKHLPYIEAARTLGLGRLRVLVSHLLPALAPLIVTSFFLQFTYGIVEVSSMSFLGLGVSPGSPDWGRMMFENRSVIGTNVWATAVPGICVVALAVSANVLGDWVYARFEAGARER
jgi:ABC-type dipeptide/oligopeptide/nickel transport system permease subunit